MPSSMCGILAHGFQWLRCSECGRDKLLAFICKRRGFCPSRGARRMSQTAAHLVDLLPNAKLCASVALELLCADRSGQPAGFRVARRAAIPKVRSAG